MKTFKRVTADFLGYQLDARENCYTPWFVIKVPEGYDGDLSKWNGSTASISTLIKFGIDIPQIPKYIPAQFFGNKSIVFSCSVCFKSFGLDKIQALEHIKVTKHPPIHEEVTIEEQVQEKEFPSYATARTAVVYDREHPERQDDTLPEEALVEKPHKPQLKRTLPVPTEEKPKLDPDALLERHRKKHIQPEESDIYDSAEVKLRAKMERKFPFLKKESTNA